MVHIDIKYVGNFKGEGRILQFTAVDDATRIAYAKLYRRKTTANSLSFLKELYKFFDCRIQSILTDKGLKFTNIRRVPGSHILDEFCLKNSGKHKLTRKRRETNEW